MGITQFKQTPEFKNIITNLRAPRTTATPIQQITQEKAATQTPASPVGAASYGTIGTNRAVIPRFLYRPPFGYPREADLTEMRRLAKCHIVDMAITTIVDEVASVEWEIQPADQDAPADKQIDIVEDFIQNPNENKENFKTVIKRALRDVLEIDAGVLTKVYTRDSYDVTQTPYQILPTTYPSYNSPTPYGVDTTKIDASPFNENLILKDQGQRELVGIYAMDAATFTLNPDRYGVFPQQAAYFQYGWIAGSRPIPFARDEIIYMMRNPRTDSIYGRSPCEVLSEVIDSLIYGTHNHLEYYTDNRIPSGVVQVLGGDADAVSAFQDQLSQSLARTDNLSGAKRRYFHKLPVLNYETKFTKFALTDEELRALEHQEWFSKLVWACYDDKTEILTENGWKLFKDLDKNERVAQVSRDDLEISFVKPEGHQEYGYDGNLIKYKKKTIDLAVTPNHRMLCLSDYDFYQKNDRLWEVKEASAFKRGIIPQAGKWKGCEIDEMVFESIDKKSGGDIDAEIFRINGNLFAKFMGIWLADGWVETGNNRIVLCASEVYPKTQKKIKELLDKMGVSWYERKQKVSISLKDRTSYAKKPSSQYRFCNRAFADYLRQFGKAKDKFVPKELKNTTPKQMQMFREYYKMGDGSDATKTHNERYGSMSKELLNGVQEMFLKMGIATSLRLNNLNQCWTLTVRRTKNNIPEKFYASIANNGDVIEEPYKGKVYCVTVPERFIVVRRNGIPSICGNCYGVTPNELGFTDDVNKASSIIQTDVFKRKAVKPLLDLLRWYLNRELIPDILQLPLEAKAPVKFEFIEYDIQEDERKHKLYEIELRNGFRTPNEVREEMGLDAIEGADELRKGGGSAPFQQGFEETMDRYLPTKSEKKSLTATSPLALIGREKPTRNKLEKQFEDLLVTFLNQNEREITEKLRASYNMDTLNQIKVKSSFIDNLAKSIRNIIDPRTLKAELFGLTGSAYSKGVDNAENELRMNFIPPTGATEFLSDHIFENVKDMTDELANDLRAELQRGILNGEDIGKLTKRVKSVMDTTKTRAKAIAVTETNRAVNSGALEGYKQSGVVKEKRFLAQIDDKTSEICKRLNGQQVPLHEPFVDPKTGEGYMNPPCHPFCRSVLEPVLND